MSKKLIAKLAELRQEHRAVEIAYGYHRAKSETDENHAIKAQQYQEVMRSLEERVDVIIIALEEIALERAHHRLVIEHILRKNTA